MKVVTFLTILACFTFGNSSRQYFVLTVFKEIQKYVLNMVQHRGLNPRHMLYNKNSTNHYNLCRYLLAAPLFEISSEVNPINRVDTGFHSIDLNAADQLLDMCRVKSSRQNRTYNIAGVKITFPSYPCVNHDSKFTWLVSYGTGEFFGFLFTTVPSNSIYALIDHTTKMSGYNSTIGSEFLKSTNSLQSECLCNLNKISQFRLCAICADSYHRKIHGTRSSYHRREEMNTDEETYADPHFNYYNDTHYENKEHCPNQYVLVSNTEEVTTVIAPALYCHISIKETSYEFYVKKNLNENGNKNSVYIIENKRVIGKVSINQLANILTMDAYL